jgi:broad specificity polyphosphatase/5'/3'-nucleotidase SurE
MPILGWDVYSHSATAMAMTAANAYNVYAVAFNQDLGGLEPSRLAFVQSEKVVPDYLKVTPCERGRCWNVNIPMPKSVPKGYQETRTAHYSPSYLPSTDIVPRARNEASDVVAFSQGFVAITSLALRVNPALRY